jgi:hypothetical protein
MKSKNILFLVLASASSFSILNSPLSQACDQGSVSNFDHIVSILKDTKNEADTEFYNFSTGSCEKIKPHANEVEISSYIPKDETSLGLYSLNRSKGENQTSSIKHVYQYIVDNKQTL